MPIKAWIRWGRARAASSITQPPMLEADQDLRPLGQPVEHLKHVGAPARHRRVLESARRLAVAEMIEAQERLAALQRQGLQMGRLGARHVGAKAADEHQPGGPPGMAGDRRIVSAPLRSSPNDFAGRTFSLSGHVKCLTLLDDMVADTADSARAASPPAPQAAAASRPAVILQVLPALVTGGVERGTPRRRRRDRTGRRQRAGRLGGPARWCASSSASAPATSPCRLIARPRGRSWPIGGAWPSSSRRMPSTSCTARSRAPAWSARGAARQTGRAFVTTFHGHLQLQLAVQSVGTTPSWRRATA